MLKAAMTRADITPPKGLELAGYPNPRPNEGFHDPLYAACMYLNNGSTEVTMVTLDLLFFSKKHVTEIRRKVEEACGIPGNHVMISCSHTHSGPWASGRLGVESLEDGIEQPHEYVAFLIETITELIKKAQKEAFDAAFTYGVGLCGAESGVGGNRRFPGGPHDPLVSVMAIRDMENKVRGVLTNYTLHPTFIHEDSYVCTADYPCYLKQEIEEQYGCIVGFSQGTSGNQSSRYYRTGESYDEAERVGRLLGKAACTVLEKAVWETELPISVAVAEQELKLRDFGTEEELMIKAAEDEKNYNYLYEKYGTSTNRDEYYLWQNAHLKRLGSRNQLGLVRVRNKGIKFELLEDEVPAQVQAIRLGGCCVIGIPGEAFVEYGLYLKAMAGFGTVIVNELTNGCLPGYMYTPESIITGGYETDTSILAEDFGIELTNTALAVARSLR